MWHTHLFCSCACVVCVRALSVWTLTRFVSLCARFVFACAAYLDVVSSFTARTLFARRECVRLHSVRGWNTRACSARYQAACVCALSRRAARAYEAHMYDVCMSALRVRSFRWRVQHASDLRSRSLCACAPVTCTRVLYTCEQSIWMRRSRALNMRSMCPVKCRVRVACA